MKRFCQIMNGKAHWIFEAEEKPAFAPNIIIIDITDAEYSNIEEGWIYDKTNNSFQPPLEEPPVLPSISLPTIEERLDSLQNTVDLILLKQEGIL